MYASDLDDTSPSPSAAGGPGARVLSALERALSRQQGTLLLWIPVCLAIGIGGYFTLPVEPTRAAYMTIAPVLIGAVVGARVLGGALAPLFLALAVVCSGVLVAGARAHWVAAPVLEFRYYGPIEGRIVGMDRSSSGARRLTLDTVRLADVAPARTPQRVRVSLHGEQTWLDPAPGMTVMLTGHLSPPGGPVEPGGFDFARKAWFERLGAVGYTRTPVLLAAPLEHRLHLVVFRIRMALSQAIQEALPGPRGAFATAILTGDRSEIPADALEALRGSNLAHLLAISGLHMGLLTGVVFTTIRGGMALVPAVALRVPGKKIAAACALGAGAFYLALSGGNVATVRAFIMVSVMLVAVLLNRRAISLRSVAIAATIVLLLTPEALSGPGFQMSFAATVALVGAFALLQDWEGRRLPRWVAPVATLVFSSAIAGLATAPFAAAHFNRFTDYGLIANLLSVPVMGAVIMPAAVLAAALAPFGLGWLGLMVMGWGLDWILWVATWVTSLDGAITPVIAPEPWVLPLLSVGALFALLWQGALRWGGLVPVCTAFAIWASTDRPALLVAESGGLVGWMTDEGRALSKGRGDSFAAMVWLENDGDLVAQETAFARANPDLVPGNLKLTIGGATVRHITGRGRTERAMTACDVDILIVNVRLDERPRGDCLLLDASVLNARGSVALLGNEDQGPTIVYAKDRTSQRLWHAR